MQPFRSRPSPERPARVQVRDVHNFAGLALHPPLVRASPLAILALIQTSLTTVTEIFSRDLYCSIRDHPYPNSTPLDHVLDRALDHATASHLYSPGAFAAAVSAVERPCCRPGPRACDRGPRMPSLSPLQVHVLLEQCRSPSRWTRAVEIDHALGTIEAQPCSLHTVRGTRIPQLVRVWHALLRPGLLPLAIPALIPNESHRRRDSPTQSCTITTSSIPSYYAPGRSPMCQLYQSFPRRPRPRPRPSITRRGCRYQCSRGKGIELGRTRYTRRRTSCALVESSRCACWLSNADRSLAGLARESPWVEADYA
ncbi:hypothetical protein L227DRAFT_300096 [Lentinus tigrinus ALCF2SS1-6]|uniref:Uncharacterized protein n=1 Tax=Lentinus tigrinus ALCF2SS1-6 TaxID=1328759 RepID=A0A5C2RXF4_9APHY|nr:hypothetical protein L227DRAFT_300096 [Lentinus tigrinus ALCF2SS1-6]